MTPTPSHDGAALRGVEIVQDGGLTRSAFLLRGAVGAGALYGLGAVGPFVHRAIAQSGGGDVEILNFALTLEYLEADFYRQAGELDLEDPVAELANEFGENEQAHVDVLVSTIGELGGEPVEEPRFEFPMTDQASFLELAVTLEDTGVSAYNGAGPSLESKELLAAAGSIVQVEARHAALVRMQVEEAPAPEAFDEALDEQQVTEAVTPFIQSQ